MSRDSSNSSTSAGGKLIEIGGHFGRATGMEPVALSKCSFVVPDEIRAEHCISALLQFEKHLRKRDVGSTRYEWANIVRKGLQFELDIFWYDQDYYADRRQAFLVGAHPLALERFGCRPSDLAVVHYSP